MSKNYFTDEQVIEMHNKFCAFTNTPLVNNFTDGDIKNLRFIMNLAVETAIGDAVGNVFINKDIVGVAFHSPLNQVKDNQLLYTVQELDN